MPKRHIHMAPPRRGLDIPAVVSLLLALGVTCAPVLAPSSKSIFADGRQVVQGAAQAQATIAGSFYGSLAPEPLRPSQRLAHSGVLVLNTSAMDLNTIDMSAFGDVDAE